MNHYRKDLYIKSNSDVLQHLSTQTYSNNQLMNSTENSTQTNEDVIVVKCNKVERKNMENENSFIPVYNEDIEIVGNSVQKRWNFSTRSKSQGYNRYFFPLLIKEKNKHRIVKDIKKLNVPTNDIEDKKEWLNKNQIMNLVADQRRRMNSNIIREISINEKMRPQTRSMHKKNILKESLFTKSLRKEDIFLTKDKIQLQVINKNDRRRSSNYRFFPKPLLGNEFILKKTKINHKLNA